jgi:hypothetical protein
MILFISIQTRRRGDWRLINYVTFGAAAEQLAKAQRLAAKYRVHLNGLFPGAAARSRLSRPAITATGRSRWPNHVWIPLPVRPQ